MDPAAKVRILIVEDDRPHAEVLAETLCKEGYACDVVYSGREGLQRVEHGAYEIVLTDLVMRDADGLEVLRHARQVAPETEVIVLTGYPSYETCIEALNEGAFTYLNKPMHPGMLRAWVRKALDRQGLVRDNVELRKKLDRKYGFEGIVGNSQAMQRVFDTLMAIAATEATVLITGDSGTGKELVARAIHNQSKRKRRRFVALNCAALSETVLDSELFGHEKGAFTGALYSRKGRFEYADGGTLFLDEIGDMPATLQAKLLRAVQEREVTRVGSNEPIPVDVRLIAASNQDLEAAIREGRFRQDLYFRLKVVLIHLPPLRERLDDLPVLVEAFLKEFSEQHGKKVDGIAPEAIRQFYPYSWPGNVRELRNVVESMVVMARSPQLTAADIPAYLSSTAPPPLPAAGAVGRLDLRAVEEDAIRRAFAELSNPQAGGLLESVEKDLIRRLLAMNGGNRERTARVLGIGERTLYRKIKDYDLE